MSGQRGWWIDAGLFGFLFLYPFLGAMGVEQTLFDITGRSIGSEFVILFIYAILAMGLNVVVGYTGLLHLGIAAFFGIGAYITGILTIATNPFQLNFLAAVACAVAGTAFTGVILGAPTLRLRGDYLALVTLGFGEVVRFALRNFNEITGGTAGLNPIPKPPEWMAAPFGWIGLGTNWYTDYYLFYYLAFLFLAGVYFLLRNLEKSRLGRAWMAIREDELAATCMGVSAAKVKLSAFALGAGLAGLAGCLYVTKLGSTAQPDNYDFARSTSILCCIILGGLGSLRGALVGVFLLIGFDNILGPTIESLIQNAGINPTGNRFLTYSSWKLMIFGLALILMMRFRPEGLVPSSRVREAIRKPKLTPAGGN